MSKVTAGFSMSLDGFVADEDDGVDLVFKWYSIGDSTAEVQSGDGPSACRPRVRSTSKRPARWQACWSRPGGRLISRTPGAAGIRWACRRRRHPFGT